MKCGIIDCSCGQQFYFESNGRLVGYTKGHVPIYSEDEGTVACIKCGKEYSLSGYPDKPVEEVLEEDVASPLDIASSILDAALKAPKEGDEDGTDI